MPHVSEVRATSHDDHDAMLIAALAAGDLAGDDRDRAIALTDSCVDCATLHDDLTALARATASAPPPITTRPRDFRLTPADAARLRPGGWRRLLGGLAWPSPSTSKPFGVGLATIGLVGLLIGNVQLNLGTSAAAPEAAQSTIGGGAPAAAGSAAAPSTSSDRAVVAAAPSAAASQAPALVSAPAASYVALAPAPGVQGSTGFESYGAAGASDSADAGRDVPTAQGSAKDQLTALADQAGGGLAGRGVTGDTAPFRPLNLLFGGAIVVGIGLLVGSRLRGRRTV